MLKQGLTAWRPTQAKGWKGGMGRTHICLPNHGRMLCVNKRPHPNNWEEVEEVVMEQLCMSCKRYAIMLVSTGVPRGPLQRADWVIKAQQAGMEVNFV